MYRWGSWKISESESAGIRVRQHRDFSITVDLEDYTNKFITGAPITRERSRQRQESLTAQELSMMRGVLGTASWRAQQMSPQFAADVFAIECDGTSRGTRSSGRQQAGPRCASQSCTVSSFSLFQSDSVAAAGFCFVGRCERSSPSRWISNRRLRDNSGH